ncbi:hypothetical protein, partial [Paenibacillus macerans]|uniref:hypothetical protein n=1 Tax=Paenibacillus macerans TaxID=44252 RepID=UPI0022E1BAED
HQDTNPLDSPFSPFTWRRFVTQLETTTVQKCPPLIQRQFRQWIAALPSYNQGLSADFFTAKVES